MDIEAISVRILSSSASRVKNAPLLFRMSVVNTKAIGDSGEQVEIGVVCTGGGGGSKSLLVLAMLVSEYKLLKTASPACVDKRKPFTR